VHPRLDGRGAAARGPRAGPRRGRPPAAEPAARPGSGPPAGRCGLTHERPRAEARSRHARCLNECPEGDRNGTDTPDGVGAGLLTLANGSPNELVRRLLKPSPVLCGNGGPSSRAPVRPELRCHGPSMTAWPPSGARTTGKDTEGDPTTYVGSPSGPLSQRSCTGLPPGNRRVTWRCDECTCPRQRRESQTSIPAIAAVRAFSEPRWRHNRTRAVCRFEW